MDYTKQVFIVLLFSITFLVGIIYLIINEDDYTKGVVYIENTEEYGRVIWKYQDKEVILDEKEMINMQEISQMYKETGEYPTDKNGNDIAAFYGFEGLEYSPLGDYVTYKEKTYDGFYLKLYNLKRKKIEKVFDSPQYYGFTYDEGEFYSCSSDFSRDLKDAKVYSLPKLGVLLDAYEEEYNKGFVDIECIYTGDDIQINLSGMYYDKEKDEFSKKEEVNLNYTCQSYQK